MRDWFPVLLPPITAPRPPPPCPPTAPRPHCTAVRNAATPRHPEASGRVRPCTHPRPGGKTALGLGACSGLVDRSAPHASRNSPNTAHRGAAEHVSGSFVTSSSSKDRRRRDACERGRRRPKPRGPSAWALPASGWVAFCGGGVPCIPGIYQHPSSTHWVSGAPAQVGQPKTSPDLAQWPEVGVGWAGRPGGGGVVGSAGGSEKAVAPGSSSFASRWTQPSPCRHRQRPARSRGGGRETVICGDGPVPHAGRQLRVASPALRSGHWGRSVSCRGREALRSGASVARVTDARHGPCPSSPGEEDASVLACSFPASSVSACPSGCRG